MQAGQGSLHPVILSALTHLHGQQMVQTMQTEGLGSEQSQKQFSQLFLSPFKKDDHWWFYWVIFKMFLLF